MPAMAVQDELHAQSLSLLAPGGPEPLNIDDS